MKNARSAAGLLGLAMLFWFVELVLAQPPPGGPRPPPPQPPVTRALPADYTTELPLFPRSAAKSKDAAVALSAHYFEARCLEALDHKDEACDIYQQVAEAKNPNPYREDARETAARIALARGRKADALKQYEALSNETQKPALKAETTVRAGLIALDLLQSDRGKIDKGMADKAMALFQKGRALPE